VCVFACVCACVCIAQILEALSGRGSLRLSGDQVETAAWHVMLSQTTLTVSCKDLLDNQNGVLGALGVKLSSIDRMSLEKLLAKDCASQTWPLMSCASKIDVCEHYLQTSHNLQVEILKSQLQSSLVSERS
jgi:adhesin HecA-like repeat protein